MSRGSVYEDARDSAPNERTGLLRGRDAAQSSSTNNATWTFLCDSHHTPGTDSSNMMVRWPANVWHVMKKTILSNYVNILLLCVPMGIIAGERHWGATSVFLWNFFGIIPLAAVLSFATEEISAHLGETMGGLLNATFGNAVELIVSIVALRAGQIAVVQASMLGSILSNLLLVLGMAFLLGGLKNMTSANGEGREQSFTRGTAQISSSLMTLSSASMILPATLYSVLDASNKTGKKQQEKSILLLSRGTSIFLLFLYVLYLVYQLRTHKNLFDAEAMKNARSDGPAGVLRGDDEDEDEVAAEHSEQHQPMSPWAAAIVLIITTVLVSFLADYLVGSIDAIVATGKISKNFIGLILIPIVANAAEHVTAIVVAWHDKMDLAMGVAIGSSIQIALLVTPFLVILGWIIGQPMSLHFETFETVAFALSVLVVTYTIQDGRSNYLEGAMLCGLYFIIALAFFVTPADSMDHGAAVIRGLLHI